MHNEFTAVFERDGEWHIAYCPEIPGANGQGHTKEEARDSLAAAIALILEDRREECLRGVPPDADRKTVIVKCIATAAILPEAVDQFDLDGNFTGALQHRRPRIGAA